MDSILAKASNQVVSFAIRLGISLASGYAIKTVAKFLDKIPAAEKTRIELLRKRLLAKIRLVSASIDLIRLAAARGNSSLDIALDLVEDLNADIDAFNDSIAVISSSFSGANEADLIARVEASMTRLLSSINDVAPLLNLAISTLGVTMASSFSSSISPGRLLQASNYVSHANEDPKPCRVGPVFDLVTYLVFYNPSRLKYIDHEVDVTSCISWKETFARAKAHIKKIGNMEFQLVIEESFDDDRYHEDNEVAKRKIFDMSTVSRLFFSASGELLNLDDNSLPVLIVKFEEKGTEEWLALGELKKDQFDSNESQDDTSDLDNEDTHSKLGIKSEPEHTSLSLLEYILRLCRLQQMEGKNLLEIKDEVLAQYLQDEPQKGYDAAQFEPTSAQYLIKSETQDKITQESNLRRLQNLGI